MCSCGLSQAALGVCHTENRRQARQCSGFTSQQKRNTPKPAMAAGLELSGTAMSDLVEEQRAGLSLLGQESSTKTRMAVPESSSKDST